MMNSGIKPYLVLTFLLLASGAWAQVPCRVTAQPIVEVPPVQLSLADILSPDTCAEMLQASASITLGRSPLPGSARVLERDPIEALLYRLQRRDATLRDRKLIVHLPERITLRRAGLATSCDEMRAQLQLSRMADSSVHDRDCGSAGRILRTAPLQIVRRVWNPASANWSVFVRCTRLADCVPFLIQIRDLPLEATPVGDSVLDRNRTDAAPVIRVGQRATLLWDRDGIRLELPSICLDTGRPGDVVRARLRSGRVVRAVVVGSGSLRVVS